MLRKGATPTDSEFMWLFDRYPQKVRTLVIKIDLVDDRPHSNGDFAFRDR
jgi:hypothetical protein